MASNSKNKLLAAYSSNKKKNAEQTAKIASGVPLSTPVAETPKAEVVEAAPVAEKKEEPKKATPKKAATNRKPAAKKAEPKKAAAAKEGSAKRKPGRPVADARSEEPVIAKSVKITEREEAALRYMGLMNPSLAQLTIFRDALDEYFEAHGIYSEMEKMGLI